MRNNDLLLQLLRLFLQRRQGQTPRPPGGLGRGGWGLRPRRRRGPLRALLRLVLLGVLLVVIVRACHSREVDAPRAAAAESPRDATAPSRATWL